MTAGHSQPHGQREQYDISWAHQLHHGGAILCKVVRILLAAIDDPSDLRRGGGSPTGHLNG